MKHRGWVWTLVVAGVLSLAARAGWAQLPFGEQRYEYELADVLPGASRFEEVDRYWRGYRDESDESLHGFVLLTDDLVDVPGYSGETMNTLVGMDLEGNLTGVRIVRHAEPIVLIGLSEDTIHAFIDQYTGRHIADRILISDTPQEGYVIIDGISGATVTAVAENATILEAGRLVARAEGVVSAADVRSRRPDKGFRAMSWSELDAAGAIGSIEVMPGERGLPSGSKSVAVVFAVLDPPSVGRNLIGAPFFESVEQRLANDGGSALYIGGSGELSFKGAGFARGGIFDRFVIEQNGELFVFKDLDYIGFPTPEAQGAPTLREGGIFFVDEGFDPTAPFSFRLTVPYRVNDERSYATFLADYQLPDLFIDSDAPFWVTRWREASVPAVLTGAFLLFLIGAFFLKERLTPHRKLLHLWTGLAAALLLGVAFKAQPSTTQILTFTGSLRRFEFPREVFLSEPLIFMLWIVIVVTLVLWGRGFFCGWVCPYGALLELLVTLWHRVAPEGFRKKVDAWQPPPFLRYGKIATFAVILLVSFASLPTAEALDEIEPFKTFVLHLARPAPFVLYFVIITLVSAVSYRFFCRFMCPLGGALAIPSRKPFLPLYRYETCTRCKICAKGCEPGAISFKTGRIDYQECLQCWDCQATGKDASVCPELIVSNKQGRAPVVITVALLLSVGLGFGDARADGRWVAPGELSGALEAATDGDLLILEPGVYQGPIRVEKSITLMAEDGAILDGGRVGHAVTIGAPAVTIEGLTIRNCGHDEEIADAGFWVEKRAAGTRLIGNTVRSCRFGIWIHGAPRVELTANTIEGIASLSESRRGDCIHLHDADEARVTGNTMSSCRDGIYMELTSAATIDKNEIRDSRYAVHTMWCDRSHYTGNLAERNLVGLALMFSERIEALENTLYGNRSHGLLLVQVTRAKVHANTIIGNTKGLFVYNSLYNDIQLNLIASNHLGVHYWGGAEDNEMTGNAFIGNELQAKFIAAKDQNWQGNYWSDYGGWDVDDDGCGETPYHSNTLVDAVLWKYPQAKFLLASPAFQLLALAEREFPVITVPKAVDEAPLMTPPMADWEQTLVRYPGQPQRYYLEIDKLPHLPGEKQVSGGHH